MSEARKLGLQISLGSGPIRERLALAKEAEDLGYSSLWVAEVSGPDALVSLGALALTPPRLTLPPESSRFRSEPRARWR